MKKIYYEYFKEDYNDEDYNENENNLDTGLIWKNGLLICTIDSDFYNDILYWFNEGFQEIFDEDNNICTPCKNWDFNMFSSAVLDFLHENYSSWLIDELDNIDDLRFNKPNIPGLLTIEDLFDNIRIYTRRNYNFI